MTAAASPTPAPRAPASFTARPPRRTRWRPGEERERDRLILQLRAEDPQRWSYTALASALGCSRERRCARASSQRLTHGVRRRRVAAPSASPPSANATTTSRSCQTWAVSVPRVRWVIASTAYESGSTLLTASSTPGSVSRGDEQPAQQDLREDDQRQELDGLELGPREGADEQAERRAEDGVGHRDQAEQPDRALDVEAEQPDAHRDREQRLERRRRGRTRGRTRAGSRACPSASRAAARACRWSARAAWSRWSRGTSR